MTAAEALALILAGTVPGTVWNDNIGEWEIARIDWTTTCEVGGSEDEWLAERATIVDAEMAQARRDRTMTSSAGPIPGSLDERHLSGALARLGIPLDGLNRVTITRDVVTVTHRVDGQLVDVQVPVVWP